MAEIRRAIERVPYAEMRRSTSGKGLHLYLLLDDIQVANHTEHAGLARALLGMFCHDAGLDFAPRLIAWAETCGFGAGARRWKIEHFERLKDAARPLTPDDLPPDWREHLEVVTRRRTRVRVPGVDEDSFSETAGACKVARRGAHANRGGVQEAGYTFYYMPDYGCYHGHTGAMAKVHKELELRGFFKTNSADTDPGTPNCYFFPRSGGIFFVVRFQTQDEHDSWGRTAKGERCCYYNGRLT